MQDIDSYLAKMGVKDASLRRRLENAVPYADQAALGAPGDGSAPAPVAPLNAAAREAAAAAASGAAASGAGGAAGDAPVLLVCCDASGGLGGLEQLLAAMDLPVFAVRLPEGEVQDAPAELAELAMLGCKAMRGVVPPGARLVLAGAWGQAGGLGRLSRAPRLYPSTDPQRCDAPSAPLPPLHLALQAWALAGCWPTSWRCS